MKRRTSTNQKDAVLTTSDKKPRSTHPFKLAVPEPMQKGAAESYGLAGSNELSGYSSGSRYSIPLPTSFLSRRKQQWLERKTATLTTTTTPTTSSRGATPSQLNHARASNLVEAMSPPMLPNKDVEATLGLGLSPFQLDTTGRNGHDVSAQIAMVSPDRIGMGTSRRSSRALGQTDIASTKRRASAPASTFQLSYMASNTGFEKTRRASATTSRNLKTPPPSVPETSSSRPMPSIEENQSLSEGMAAYTKMTEAATVDSFPTIVPKAHLSEDASSTGPVDRAHVTDDFSSNDKLSFENKSFYFVHEVEDIATATVYGTTEAASSRAWAPTRIGIPWEANDLSPFELKKIFSAVDAAACGKTFKHKYDQHGDGGEEDQKLPAKVTIILPNSHSVTTRGVYGIANARDSRRSVAHWSPSAGEPRVEIHPFHEALAFPLIDDDVLEGVGRDGRHFPEDDGSFTSAMCRRASPRCVADSLLDSSKFPSLQSMVADMKGNDTADYEGFALKDSFLPGPNHNTISNQWDDKPCSAASLFGSCDATSVATSTTHAQAALKNPKLYKALDALHQDILQRKAQIRRMAELCGMKNLFQEDSPTDNHNSTLEENTIDFPLLESIRKKWDSQHEKKRRLVPVPQARSTTQGYGYYGELPSWETEDSGKFAAV
jgi:hypothetical protein